MSSSNEKTILVVDDSNTNIVLIDAVLAEKGYNIKTAFSVKEAEEIIAKTKPNLILLDLLMPKISGYDFLRNIKSMSQFKDVPVIIISAHNASESKAETEQLGAIDFIDKPIDIDQLVKKVENILNN